MKKTVSIPPLKFYVLILGRHFLDRLSIFSGVFTVLSRHQYRHVLHLSQKICKNLLIKIKDPFENAIHCVDKYLERSLNGQDIVELRNELTLGLTYRGIYTDKNLHPDFRG
jgi:hypothetical protein